MLPANPYSPPRAEVELLPEMGVAVRKNELIGVPRVCSLPLICATCGQTEGVQQVQMTLNPGAFWVTPHSGMHIPQCPKCTRRWTLAKRLERSFSFFPFFMILSSRLGSLSMAMLFLIAGPAAFIVGREMIDLRVVRKDAERIWLKGVDATAAAVYCGEIPDVDLG